MSTFPLRVIVLEDHSFQRSIAVTMLRQLGCSEVFQAANGVQALELLKSVGRVDVAICDLYMGGMDGLEFLQQVDRLGLVESVIISSSLSMDLRRTVRQLVTLLRIKLLGDIGKPLHFGPLETLLKKHAFQPVPEKPLSLPLTIPPPSDEAIYLAMKNKEFYPYFQPKFVLQTGEVKGVEVLTRWQHPTHGVLTPAVFMAAMERCDLMDELLLDQLRQSLFLQRQAKNSGHVLNFAFNVLTTQLANEKLTLQIKDLLAEFNLPGAGLTFELTESSLLKATATSLKSLVHLRMMGCKLSIDDFGSGFSSLQRLCQLPFNEIKLDAEFAQSFIDEPRSRVIISTTLALGATLEMSVVIEGIETEEQRVQLVALGCTEGQGFVYARPMSGFHLLQWLDEKRALQHQGSKAF